MPEKICTLTCQKDKKRDRVQVEKRIQRFLLIFCNENTQSPDSSSKECSEIEWKTRNKSI